jgi:hypothetical protein
MSRLIPVVAATLAAGWLSALPEASAPAEQARRAPARVKEAPKMVCHAALGVGVTTQQTFCDVLTGTDPADGIRITIPPHRGEATLTFDLHNRHTYSEEQVRANRAYARYTAVIGVLTMDNTLLSRAVVQNEFRRASDIVDRIRSDVGPMGVKAVVPTGTEPISIGIPQAENEVSVLGEKLTVERLDGTATYMSPGRPVAVISNVMIDYRPR